MPKIVFATDSTVVGNSTNRVRVVKNEPWWADDPFVLAHPEMFGPLPDERAIRGQRPTDALVEQATAAPGERRTARRV